MQYLSYNANKWLQSLDLKAIWFVAMVQTTILSSHTLIINAVLSGYITTLKNKQKLDVSSEGPS
jgi:hypothetical protein